MLKPLELEEDNSKRYKIKITLKKKENSKTLKYLVK
jgi:hypothetical protein